MHIPSYWTLTGLRTSTKCSSNLELVHEAIAHDMLIGAMLKEEEEFHIFGIMETFSL